VANQAAGGVGDDLIRLDGTASIGAITGEDGSDTILLLSGTVAGQAAGGSGDDLIRLDGATVQTNLSGEDGNDVIELLSGVVMNTVRGRPGDDQVTLSGASVGNRIRLDEGDDLFTWTAGRMVEFIGSDGSDTVLVTAASYIGTSDILNGGDDYSIADGWIDELILGGAVTGDINGANLLNWERIFLDQVSVRLADAVLEVGADVGSGLFITGSSTLDQTGIGLSLTGNLTHDGTMTLQDGAIGDVVVVNGAYTGGGGQLLIDVDTSADLADRLSITGDASGTTEIVIDNLSPAVATGNDILVVRVAGSSAPGAFTMTPFQAGVFEYSLELLPDGNWYLVAEEVPPQSVPMVPWYALGFLAMLLGFLGHRGLRRPAPVASTC
jgi:hypothetical protein